MAKHEWTRWYKFSDVFHHHKWIADNGTSKYRITINNETGPLHTDEGFRLKSLQKGTLSGYHETKDEDTCPLKKGDLGLYWIHIKSSNGVESKNYIGMSAEFNEKGIMGRLIDHFQKLSVLPLRKEIKNYRNKPQIRVSPDGDWDLGTYDSVDNFREAIEINVDRRNRLWKETHEEYMSKGVDLYDKFNDDLISLCFYKMGNSEQIEPTDRSVLKAEIKNAEAWAHQNFKKKYNGDKPNLNVVDEGKNFNGNDPDMMKGFADRLAEKHGRNMPIDIFKNRVEQLSDHAQSIFEYVESKTYEDVSSDLLMHIISNGKDMRISAPPYNARGRAVRRLGDGETRRNIMVLIPKINKNTFLVRTYLEPNDLRNIVNNVEETPDYETSMNSQFILDENVTVHLFEKVMLETLNKWKREFR